MDQPSTATPTRRALLTAAAWSIPTVAIAAAAPAYASSGALIFSTAPSAEITRTPTKHFHGTLALTNSHTVATDSLQIVVVLPGGYASAQPTPLVINRGAAGWTVAAAHAGGEYTYTFTATTQLGGKQTAHVTFDMDLLGTLPATLPTITVTASARNMTGTSVAAAPTYAY